MKPNLFIPGFPKSGTSSLHSMLCEHPEISEGRIKEPHTYSWNNRYKNRHSFFQKEYDFKGSTYCLDSSTSYMISKYAINRIIDETPEAKFLVIARDPIDRIVSHYNWLCQLGFINRTFENEIMEELHNDFNYRHHYDGNYKCFLEFSKYGEQYEYLKTLVPNSQILFLIFEDVFSQWDQKSKEIGGFLGLNLENISVRAENQTTGKKNFFKSDSGFNLKNLLIKEYGFLRGIPRGFKVKKPIMNKVERFEVESFLFPFLKEDLLKLKSSNIDISSWETNKFL